MKFCGTQELNAFGNQHERLSSFCMVLLSVPEIKCMLSTLISLGIFFRYSPKRQRQLEESIIQYNQVLKEQSKKEIHKTKIKTMCQTRWVEKHTSMEDLNMLYPALIQCLDFIVNNKHNWVGKTIGKQMDTYPTLCLHLLLQHLK